MTGERVVPSHTIYRGVVALELQPTLTAVSPARPKPVHTVMWIAARERYVGSGVAGQGYGWDDPAVSLRVQVTVREMPDVLAVLLGYRSGCEFRHHGSKRDKSYELAFSSGGVLRVVLSSGLHGQFSFKLDSADRFMFSTICFRALQKQHGGLGSDLLHTLLRDSYLAAPPAGTLYQS